MFRASIFYSIAFVLFLSNIAHAQITPTIIPETLSIVATPGAPGPNAAVHLEAQSYSINLPAATITWYVNGKSVLSDVGQTSFDTQTGALGTETKISVAASAGNSSGSASTTFRPTALVVLWESDSYAPPFYRGRTLPSMGTNLRLEAIAHFVRANKTAVDTKDIIYTWLRNGLVISEISGRGRSSVTISSPQLFATDIIAVDAQSADGLFSNEAIVKIPSVEPILTLYKDHPLFGITFEQALGNSVSIQDSEMTFAAVPYFAQAASARDPRLVYAWKVNGKNIPTDKKESNRITLSGTKTGSVGEIALSLTHSTNIFEAAADAWKVMLGGTSAGGINAASDPFRSSTSP